MPARPVTRYRFNGQALRALREAAGLKREHLALATNRNTEAVVNWELGRAMPPADVLVVLCQTLNCRPEDLLFEEVDDSVAKVAKASRKAERKAQGLPERSSDEALDQAAKIIRPRAS